MRPIFKFFVVAFVACGVLYGVGRAFWGRNYPTCEMRYRLTIDIDDNGTHKFGSGVVEATDSLFPHLPDGPPIGTAIQGFAITVDLGEKGLLFLLDRGSRTRPPQRGEWGKIFSTGLALMPSELFDADQHDQNFSSDNVAQSFRDRCRAIIQYETSREIPIPFAKLPMFVRFPDPGRPESLKEVNPAELSDAYGPGVSLRSVTLRIVNAPLSQMPTSWPTWLKNKISSRNWQDRQWSAGDETFDTSAFAGE